MLSATTIYRLATKDLAKSLNLTSQAPQVAREVDYFVGRIGQIKSIDDFLKDTRIFRFAMKAFGLGEMGYAKGFMRKVLVEGIDSRSSFANRLADERYKEFAKSFNFARYGSIATSFSAATTQVVDRYVRVTLEEDVGSQNNGARLALYFQRRLPFIKDAYTVLADKALIEVVRTALDLPQAFSSADIDAQARVIEQRLDFAALANPEKAVRFLETFTTKWEISRGTASSSAMAMIGSVRPTGIRQDLLASLQGLRIGGR